VPGKIFGPKNDEVSGQFRISCKKKRYGFYRLPGTVKENPFKEQIG
jgi:hypothetical protein